MGLYFVLTIDGDWNEYFRTSVPRDKRQPDPETLLQLVRREICISRWADGKFLHFIHTSQTTPDFFLRPEFMDLWKKIEASGGSVGIHYHHENYTADGMTDPEEKLAEALEIFTESLRDKGLTVLSYRGGYLAFHKQQIPLLEKSGLRLDFSCEPDRHLFHDGKLASDWRNAPQNFYRMAYEDHRKPGTSRITEIPVGKADGGSLYLDVTPLTGVWKALRGLKQKSKSHGTPIIVSILTHTYEFDSLWKRFKIALALLLCRGYGSFINDRQATEIIQG